MILFISGFICGVLVFVWAIKFIDNEPPNYGV